MGRWATVSGLDANQTAATTAPPLPQERFSPAALIGKAALAGALLVAALEGAVGQENPPGQAAGVSCSGPRIAVTASGGDSRRPPSVQWVAARHFATDDLGRPLGLTGPRVAVELPPTIAVRLDLGSGVTRSAVPDTLIAPAPNDDGSFRLSLEPDPVHLALTTAFLTATRVIDAAERWAGHGVMWGVEGRLRIVPYASVTDALAAYYDQTERCVHIGVLGRISPRGELEGFTGLPKYWTSEVKELLLDAPGSPDVVAHEAGHAVVHALKPGWGAGVAVALHEALADMVAVLVAFEDRAVAARVLAETGGDLHRDNEATRLAEEIGGPVHRFADADATNDGMEALRSVVNDVRMDDGEVGPEDTALAAVLPICGRVSDPHFVAQIASGLLYDIFCGVYEDELSHGGGGVEAVGAASEIIGTLMLRALRFVGEHKVSLRDYAAGLLRADREFLGGAHEPILCRSLAERGLLRPDPEPSGARLPEFTLPAAVKDSGSILAAVEDLEQELLAAASGWPGERAALIRHHDRAPFPEEVGRSSVHLVDDVTADDGQRLIRVGYRVCAARLAPVRRPDEAAIEPLAPPEGLEVYVSLLFDPSGRLVLLNADRPW